MCKSSTLRIAKLFTAIIFSGGLLLNSNGADFDILQSYGTLRTVEAYDEFPTTSTYTADNGGIEAGSRVLESEISMVNYYVLDLTQIGESVEIKSITFTLPAVFAYSAGNYRLSIPSSAPSEVLAQITDNTLTSGGGTSLGSAGISGDTEVQLFGNQAFIDVINANRGSIIAIRGTFGPTRMQAGAPSITASTAVPEPSSIVLTLGALGLAMGYRMTGRRGRR